MPRSAASVLGLHNWGQIRYRTIEKINAREDFLHRMYKLYTAKNRTVTSYNISYKQCKWKFPGNFTITKHGILEVPKEGEMGHKSWQNKRRILNHTRTNKEKLQQRNRLAKVSRKTTGVCLVCVWEWGLKLVLLARNLVLIISWCINKPYKQKENRNKSGQQVKMVTTMLALQKAKWAAV